MRLHLAYPTLLALLLLPATAQSPEPADANTTDWPQWRGPDRNGIAPPGPALATTWNDGKPPLLWEAEILPRDSGESSPVVAGDRVYLFANAPRDVESPTRTLDQRFYTGIQWFDPARVPEAELTKIETARLNIPTELNPKQRRAWIDTWIKDNIANVKLRGTAKRRLLKGEDGVSLEGLTLLKGVRDKTFGNETIFLNWLDDNHVSDEDRELILGALPEGKREAKDIVFCCDLATGDVLWETQLAGRPESRLGSSTPVIADGRVYLFGTTHAHCLEATTGDTRWSTELPSPAVASSPLVTDKHVIGLAGHLIAFDRETGATAWERPELKGKKSSPVRWGDHLLVKAETARQLACLDPADGTVHWSIASTGDSTPVVAGDLLVLHEKTRAVGYRLPATDAPDDTEPEQLWAHNFIDTRGASSPVVHGEHVLVFPTTGGVCLHLETGKVIWDDTFSSGIISPILADDKLLYPTNGGSFLTILDPATGNRLSKTRVTSSRCSSAAISNGRLIVRGKTSLTAHDLKTAQ